MTGLNESMTGVAQEHRFSGVVRVDRLGEPAYVRAFGAADRALGIPNMPDTRFPVASGAKGLTALAVVSLVAEGRLSLDTSARSLLRDDLPLIDDAVTIEQLLAHRSGIGDYVDEASDIDPTDYVLTVPVHTLVTTQDYLPALAGLPHEFAPGTDFGYCNGGYVVLALLAERASGLPFHDLVEERVLRPAAMEATAYLRSDELPGDVAKAYLHEDGLRTSVLHLPVRGSGDGGVYTTLEDVHRLWAAVTAGRVVPLPWVREMARARSHIPSDEGRYGLGLWLDEVGDGQKLVGSDAGVSFLTFHKPSTGLTWTVMANSTRGAWPIVRHLEAQLR